MKNIKISDETHKKLKEYCSKNSLKLSDWIDKLVKRFLDKHVKETNN